jgi:hypothetical protein
MKKTVIAAIAVVIILLAAGAYVALSMNTPNVGGDDDGSDNNDNDDNQNDNDNDNVTDTNNNTQTLNTIDLGDRTMDITFPVSLGATEPKVDLAVSYPGQNDDGYTYNRAQTYRFQITSDPATGYSGDVLIRMFAELTDPVDEIDPQNLIVTNATGRVLEWTTDTRIGEYTNHIVLSGDLGAFRTNGNATDNRTFDVTFNYVGNFTLTFQAFDLNTSATLSAPTETDPLYVPIKGSLMVSATSGEWRTNANGTFFVVLVNITNNWNIRHTVYASDLYVSNQTIEVSANDTATSFDSQQLIPLGGTTQFLAWFDLSEQNRSGFVMQYRDSVSGQIIDVPLPV